MIRTQYAAWTEGGDAEGGLLLGKGMTDESGRAPMKSFVGAAHHAALRTHPLNPFFTELCTRRGYKMAITAVAHRLLRIIYAMLRDGSEFDVSKVQLRWGHSQKTREVLYRSLLDQDSVALRPGNTTSSQKQEEPCDLTLPLDDPSS